MAVISTDGIGVWDADRSSGHVAQEILDDS